MRSAQDVIDQSARMAKNAKNKICVRKSREKKRQMIEESKQKLAHLMSENDILKGVFESMSKELNSLKNDFTDKISLMHRENALYVIRSAKAQLAIKHVNGNGDETLSSYLDNLANRLSSCSSLEPTRMIIDLPVMITEPTPIPIEDCTPPQPVCEETKTFNLPTFLFEAKPTVSERNKNLIQSSQCVEPKQSEAVQNNDRLFEELSLNDILETIEEEWNKTKPTVSERNEKNLIQPSQCVEPKQSEAVQNKLVEDSEEVDKMLNDILESCEELKTNKAEIPAQNVDVETIKQQLKSFVNYETEPQQNQPFQQANSQFIASNNITDFVFAQNYYQPTNNINSDYYGYDLNSETTQYQTGGAQEISNGFGSVFQFEFELI